MGCDLQADPGEFKVVGEDRTTFGVYWFSLRSVHACPAKLKPGQPDSAISGGLSLGSCLFIGLLLILTLYLSIGVTFERMVRHKEGLEAVPNREFWVALPGLAKDGVVFLF